MARRKDKPRMIPEQDKNICRAICLCQLTMVLSCVSIVYLSVAIYSPSLKAFKSGFELQPVMCQTVDLQMPNNCPWASCGEWCLTRTSGFCPQIHSVVRRNGTDIKLTNCSRMANTSCAMIDMNRLNKYNCNNGTVCNNIRGVFNCSNGHCKNMSEFFLCHHKADGPTINSARDNTKLNGFFECRGVHCTKIKKPFSCDRYCSKITTTNINVLISHEDNVITASCEEAWAYNEARGKEHGIRIDPKVIWTEGNQNLLTNCATITKEDEHTLIATDCINGTLLDRSILPEPFMNFTQFWTISANSTDPLDAEQKFLPNQVNLTIYQSKKLLINLEGCVNTLRGECKDFVTRYGNDGDNNTAQSRYQCYYNKNPAVEYVVARYDLNKVYRELLVSLIVPSVLFVISAISLYIITKAVKVGDDAKMRCVCFGQNDTDDMFEDMNVKKRNTNKDLRLNGDNLHLVQATIEQQQQVDNHEMIGSTKSLIPLSASPGESGASERTAMESKSAEEFDKPLVEL